MQNLTMELEFLCIRGFQPCFVESPNINSCKLCLLYIDTLFKFQFHLKIYKMMRQILCIETDNVSRILKQNLFALIFQKFEQHTKRYSKMEFDLKFHIWITYALHSFEHFENIGLHFIK